MQNDLIYDLRALVVKLDELACDEEADLVFQTIKYIQELEAKLEGVGKRVYS